MKVLIYGYGAIGLYYSHKLTEAGYTVEIVEPRPDTEASGEVSLQFEDGISGLEYQKTVELHPKVPEDETFPLMLVCLPSHHLREHIEGIASLESVQTIVLVGGYVAHLEEWTEKIDGERTFLAYPGVSVYFDREEGRVVYCDKEEKSGDPRGITIGSVGRELPDGAEELFHVFTSSNIPVGLTEEMDSVFLSQAALRLPMTAALLHAGGSLDTLSVRGDILKLMIKGIREALAAVRRLGHNLLPPTLSTYRYVPVFMIANMMKGQFGSASSRIGIQEAALRAGGEPIVLAEEFLEITEESGVKNEHLRYLFSVFFEEEEEEEKSEELE